MESDDVITILSAQNITLKAENERLRAYIEAIRNKADWGGWQSCAGMTDALEWIEEIAAQALVRKHRNGQ